ncbi:MAG: TldD/PmbA family protein [Acidobacteriota bacterium]
MKHTKEFALSVVAAAMRKGASAAEVMIAQSTEFSTSVRLEQIETIKESLSQDLGLRVIWEGRQAAVSTSDFSLTAVTQLVDDAVELARATSVDEQLSLPDREDFAASYPDLQLYDPASTELPTETKIELALRAEAAARAADARIVNYDGGGFSSATRALILANSLGFAGDYEGTVCSLSSAPVAEEDGKMQRDYWFDCKRAFKDLESAESIGQRAAARTLRKLGGRKVKTQQVPVVFDPLVAATLLGDLLQAVSGDTIVRKASFLVGKLAEKIGCELLTIIDDGRLPGALGSRPFDSEGVPTRRTVVVERGELKSYLLNTYTARKLALKSTGNAMRSPSGTPSISCTNLFIPPGDATPEEIISSVKNGFYVTDLIGFGVNIVTGDYSRGAAGLWIENGELTYPVEEVTIASNLKDMFKQIEMVGNDLEFRSRIAAPTIKIERMTVSGE